MCIRQACCSLEPKLRHVAFHLDERMDDRASNDSMVRMAKIPVRASVRVCCRSLKLNQFLSWTPESVITFDQTSSTPLALCVGEYVIGEGQAVKIGSQLGLRLLRIGSVEELKR